MFDVDVGFLWFFIDDTERPLSSTAVTTGLSEDQPEFQISVDDGA
jgi:hypothetical protein